MSMLKDGPCVTTILTTQKKSNPPARQFYLTASGTCWEAPIVDLGASENIPSLVPDLIEPRWCALRRFTTSSRQNSRSFDYNFHMPTSSLHRLFVAFLIIIVDVIPISFARPTSPSYLLLLLQYRVSTLISATWPKSKSYLSDTQLHLQAQLRTATSDKRASTKLQDLTCPPSGMLLRHLITPT